MGKIKYRIQLGLKKLSEEDNRKRIIITKMTRMKCPLCEQDTVIEFNVDVFNKAIITINACCDIFEARIKKRLEI